ncbi:bifunctional diguanylate cyclase/phosphodiesterase [Neptunomonas sp.]|uniref:bifunctional diguanylate cyclase/phosphodiesterase n=1 Tax=Neptunomonas sp. TaxID=1971898 RepID=UPI0025E95541|nr:bifunctional diguanylate cyclase/phosphodiesterase [Neptunomonas sp.]
MAHSSLACPFCQTSKSQVKITDNNAYQVCCDNCLAMGSAAGTEELALLQWKSFCQEVSLSKFVIDESPNIVSIKDWDGRFILGNRALANLYGTTLEELVGHDDGYFNPNQEQVDFYLENLRDVIGSGEVQRVEESSTDHETGDIKHYLSVKKPFFGPSGEPGVLIIANDITELKLAYQKLEERENRYAYAMDIAGEGLWDWNLLNNTVTHNKRGCQIMGLDDKCLQHPIKDFIALLHESDRHAVSEALENMLKDATGEFIYEHEYRMRRANGEIFWVLDRGEVVERDDDGKPVRVVGVIRDIDEQKRYELHLSEATQDLSSINVQLEKTVKQRTDELYRNEERFTLAMRSANDGLWDWDVLTDRVYYSPRWKGMLGYESDELEPVLATWATMVHPDDKDNVLKKVKDYLSDEEDQFEVEMRMQHKSGHYIFIRSRAFKVISKSTGQAVRLTGTHVDISDIKRSEIFDKRTTHILEMIAKGNAASEIYDEIALLYENRYPGLRCSMLELEGRTLLHGGAPSLPKAYCEAVNGLKNGPQVGSCGASTYTGKRVVVENISTDPKWINLKDIALPHGMRCCWSEPIINSSGTVLGAFGMYYDHPAIPNDEESGALTSAARLAGIIMEREHNHRQIRELAYRDTLTGLSSRGYFYLTLEELLKLSERNHNQFSLLYLDLDDFKNVNDSLGHDTGDLLLKEVAERIKEACREADFIARLGGDEFCIIIHDVNENYHSVKIAERCLSFISQPVTLAGRKLVPACSIGIAHYPTDGNSLNTLIKAADTALYEAKNLGKNRYSFYESEFTEKAEYRFQAEQHLREAVEQQQITLVYQPQVDITSGKIIGVEALSRWHHPQLGQVPPVDFIKIAEQIGLIKPLTEWILQTVCDQMVSWGSEGFIDIRTAVNISPDHFLDEGLVSFITQTLEATDIASDKLELEVTESTVQTNIQNLSAFQRLKDLGISVAIDDFGTGYSSFSSLQHMNVDILKIDKSFIDGISFDPKTLTLVGSMIEMGHNLGYKIIAEGIESQKQLELLRKLKCDIGQGYLFSKPVTAEEVSLLLGFQLKSI